MQMILFNALLCLGIIWLLLLIGYTYAYMRHACRGGGGRAESRNEETASHEEGERILGANAPHRLVLRSKSLRAQASSDAPLHSHAEQGVSGGNTPTSPQAEATADAPKDAGGAPSALSEEENERQVAYTTEETEKLELLRRAECLGCDLETAIRLLAEEKRNAHKTP